jgi:hypothetical protein
METLDEYRAIKYFHRLKFQTLIKAEARYRE